MAKEKKEAAPIQVKEIANEVDVLVVRLYCAKDNVQMEPVGKVLPLARPMYTYQCPKCKHKQVSHNEYPMLIYREKSKDENLLGTGDSKQADNPGNTTAEKDADTTAS